MDNNYYKAYFDLERNHWWFVAREKIISNYIKKIIVDEIIPSKNLKILNVGCATGRSTQYLSEFGNVVSVEYDKECADFTIKKTGLEIINGSITDLPFLDNSFDLVCAFDVIEHVENDQLAVSEMKRVANNNGVVFITVPAFMGLWSYHDVVNQHFRRYKLNQIKKIFDSKENGKMIFTSYFNFFLFFPIYILRKISNVLNLEKKRPGAGSDFETFKLDILNNLLFEIMFFESKFINNNVKLPFGVSVLYTWKKN
jgi:SAM-dependent methyltransferase